MQNKNGVVVPGFRGTPPSLGEKIDKATELRLFTGFSGRSAAKREKEKKEPITAQLSIFI